jgi:hypothetical protein
MKSAFILYSVFFYLSTLSLSINAAQTDLKYEGVFKKIEQPSEFIKSEFHLAKLENKKLIFVLGANWCHDSRSIAKKLDDATPTVLIFDSVSEKLINASDMHIWSNAFNLSQEHANSYFEGYIEPKGDTQAPKLTEAQQLHLSKLDSFTEVQELRTKASYKTIGPLLERYKDDDVDENFKPYWKALSDLRMSLPSDIKKLREQIIMSSDNEHANISFAEYSPLPWE